MTTIESALMLARKGFRVFPIKSNSKKPAWTEFSKKATTDTEKIKKIFKRPYNIGIATSFYADDESLIVVDVDDKDGKKGSEEVLKLEMNGFELPETMEQVTPSGGRHLIFRSKTPVGLSASKLAEGLDIRAVGGYIVGAGSTLPNGEYKLIDRNIAVAPEWLVKKLGEIKPREPIPGPQYVNREVAFSRAYNYLATAPVAIEGSGGDHLTFQVAATAKDLGVSETDCLLLMNDVWNPRCLPPWSPEELATKVHNAYKHGKNPIGVNSPEADFEPIPAPEPELSYLEKINKEYALVTLESSHAILHETVDEKGRKKMSLLQEQTFKRKYSNRPVQIGKGKPPSEAELWLEWSNRREYAGLCFAPEREPKNNYYNLWKGFTCKPTPPELANDDQKRGLEMFLSHAKDNVCGGDEKLFRWLMGYFAHLMQKPYERPLTTLVFKGRKGTGKNALVERVGRLLGSSHYLVAHDGRYLTSNFNGHMDSCLMLVLDEAFWSGDKAAEGKLKGITTAPEIMIERKGKEPYMVDNLVRLIVIGNEDWLIPASQDERRYAVFQMGEGKMQNREFFRTMRVLLDEKRGGELLLHYLKTFDLSTVDVNDAPKTEALLEQKLKSGSALEQWWHECLIEGQLVRYDFSDSEWLLKTPKSNVRKAFQSYCKERNISQKFAETSDVGMGRLLHRMLPSIITNQKITEDGVRTNAYLFPELSQARKEFEQFIGHEVKW